MIKSAFDNGNYVGKTREDAVRTLTTTLMSIKSWANLREELVHYGANHPNENGKEICITRTYEEPRNLLPYVIELLRARYNRHDEQQIRHQVVGVVAQRQLRVQQQPSQDEDIDRDLGEVDNNPARAAQ